MPCNRRGLGKGYGKGYRNLMPKDKKVHSDSAKGKKQPQKMPRVPPYVSEFQTIERLEFTQPVRKETAYGVLEDYGNRKQVMTLRRGKGNLFIEWEVLDEKGDELDYAEIGIYTDGRYVREYDGVFEIPDQAIKLLKKAGYNTKEIEDDE